MTPEHHIHLDKQTTALVLRTGPAPAVFPPEFIAENGCVIEAPAEYLDKRPDAWEHAVAIINKSSMPYSIMLKLNEGTTLPTGYVGGSLAFHPEYVAWGINAEISRDPAMLLKVVRPRKSHFMRPDVYDAVVERLAHFRAQLRTDVEQTRDGVKGVKADASRRQVVDMSGKDNPEQDPSFTFVLSMPILRGMKDCTIEVTALVEPRDAMVGITLESLEARTLVEQMAEKAIEEQVERLKTFNIPILFK